MRKLRIALAVLGLLGATMIVGAPAADADVNACAGWGQASISSPHPSIAEGGPATTSTLYVYLSSGGCASLGGQVWAYIEITGWCEATEGWGVTSDGHYFDIVGSTYQFVLSGQATGTFALTGYSTPCRPVIGNTYYAAGAVAYAH